MRAHFNWQVTVTHPHDMFDVHKLQEEVTDGLLTVLNEKFAPLDPTDPSPADVPFYDVFVKYDVTDIRINNGPF